jgi:hypothetical protein
VGIGNGVVDDDLDLVNKLKYYFFHGFIDQPKVSGQDYNPILV